MINQITIQQQKSNIAQKLNDEKTPEFPAVNPLDSNEQRGADGGNFSSNAAAVTAKKS